MSQGIIYIASGSSYIEEAIESATTASDYCKNISLLTTEVPPKRLEKELNVFEEISVIDDGYGDIRDKVSLMSETPYDKTIFLDTDTRVLGDISPLFEMLNRVDIAAARSPSTIVTLSGVPDAFPELNTGVLVFNHIEEVKSLFESWERRYEKQQREGYPDEVLMVGRPEASGMDDATGFGRKNDQPAFRDALYHSQVDFSILPREYNFRGEGASVFTEVKILHGTALDNKEFNTEINRVIGHRCMWDGTLYRDGVRDVTFKRSAPYLNRVVRSIAKHTSLSSLLHRLGIYDESMRMYRKYIK